MFPPQQPKESGNIFGAARPVDTAAREREIEERMKRKEEEFKRQLGDKEGER